MIRVNDTDDQLGFSAADLTPLLDVVFIVLVFLLFTANVKTLSLPVDLPQATAQQAQSTEAPKTLTVSILKTETPWAIGEQTFSSWELFTTALLEQVKATPNTTILIAGDKAAPLGDLVKLMMFLSEHKISAAQVLMEETT